MKKCKRKHPVRLLLWLLQILVGTVLFGCSQPEILGNEAQSETEETAADAEGIEGTDSDWEGLVSADAAKPGDGEVSALEAETAVCYVHISGAVVNPGVYEVEPDARLYQVVQQAGGFAENASEEYCNLAQTVSDGTRYYIPTKEEVEELTGRSDGSYLLQDGAAEQLLSGTASSEEAAVVSCYDDEGRLDLNMAGLEELTGLPGIGEVRAEAILAYRSENGDFTSIEDLMKVSGIKDGTFQKVKDKIIVR